MKTVAEFCAELFKSKELAEKCVASRDNLELFLHENGCNGSVEEFKACVAKSFEQEQGLSDDDLAKISGGGNSLGSDVVSLELPLLRMIYKIVFG